MTVELDVDRPAFWKNANCRTAPLDLFFVERDNDNHPAHQYCATCPVRDACLEYAIVNNIQHGYWGGQSVRRRRTTRRQWINTGRLHVINNGSRPAITRLVG